MEERPYALLLKFPGTNADVETARALDEAGFESEIVPITLAGDEHLAKAKIVVISGGFSYGDYVMAGRLAQLETERRLGDSLKRFRDRGGYLLGICNGFQILMKLGLLPPGSLIDNTSGRFQCRWVTLENKRRDSPYLAMLPDRFEFPIAHAEGRFVTADESDAEGYVANGLGALTYEDDINGSLSRIAGVTDETGRVFGLMPHPERFLYARHHYDPDWKGQSDDDWGAGYWFFKSIHERIVSGE